MSRPSSTVMRIARAVANLDFGVIKKMSFSVTPGEPGEDSITLARTMAKCIGYNVMEVRLDFLPKTVQEVGRAASDDMSRLSGPILVLLDARDYDKSIRHDEIIAGVSMLAKESFSINGETALIAITNDDPVPVARHIGMSINRTDWAARIPQ